jgi:hypothetical protein
VAFFFSPFECEKALPTFVPAELSLESAKPSLPSTRSAFTACGWLESSDESALRIISVEAVGFVVIAQNDRFTRAGGRESFSTVQTNTEGTPLRNNEQSQFLSFVFVSQLIELLSPRSLHQIWRAVVNQCSEKLHLIYERESAHYEVNCRLTTFVVLQSFETRRTIAGRPSSEVGSPYRLTSAPMSHTPSVRATPTTRRQSSFAPREDLSELFAADTIVPDTAPPARTRTRSKQRETDNAAPATRFIDSLGERECMRSELDAALTNGYFCLFQIGALLLLALQVRFWRPAFSKLPPLIIT